MAYYKVKIHRPDGGLAESTIKAGSRKEAMKIATRKRRSGRGGGKIADARHEGSRKRYKVTLKDGRHTVVEARTKTEARDKVRQGGYSLVGTKIVER